MGRIYFFVIKRKRLSLILHFSIMIILGLFIVLFGQSVFDKVQYAFTDKSSLLSEGKLSIIIDDFGSTKDGVKEMLAINRHLTFAIIPFLEFSDENALTAHEKGYEVIVHLPMEPKKGKRSWLGPKPILSGMDYEKVRAIAKESIENIPYAAGVNIHMGSKASGEEVLVSAILDEVKAHDLYFVDSRTSDKPIAKKLAKDRNIVCFNRDVFLDGQQPKEFVKRRLKQAGDIALKKGYAVAIGHVGIEGGKVTADAITEMLPEFDKKNIQLVFISEL